MSVLFLRKHLYPSRFFERARARHWFDFTVANIRSAWIVVSISRPLEMALSVRINDSMHYDLAIGFNDTVGNWVMDHVKPGMVSMDVGANVGFYTVLLAKLSNDTPTIAVEADPSIAAAISRNAELNGLKNVEVIAAAAYREDGVVRLGRMPGTLWSSLYAQRPNEWIPVPARKLDSLCAELGLARLDLLKIDIEGAEGDAVAGAVASIDQFKPVVIVERHFLQSGPDSSDRIWEIQVAQPLARRGYRSERISTNQYVFWPAQHNSLKVGDS